MARVSKQPPQVQPEFIKCIYAGDPNDAFCSACNGVTITDNGKQYQADSCSGYTMEGTMDAAKPAVEEVPAIETPVESREIADTSVSAADMEDYASVAVSTVIRAESGLTMELKDARGNDRWYKFSYAEERVVPPSANMEEERVALWTTVHGEVDRQAQEITNFMHQQKV